MPNDVDARLADLERKLAAMRWRIRITTVGALAVVVAVSCASKVPPTPTPPTPTKLEFKDGGRVVDVDARGVSIQAGSASVLLTERGMFAEDSDPTLGTRTANYEAAQTYLKHDKGSSVTLSIDGLGASVTVRDPSDITAVVSAKQKTAEITAQGPGRQYSTLTAGVQPPGVSVRNEGTLASLSALADSAELGLHAGTGGHDRDVNLTSRAAGAKK
jgi:hypothetical protein